MCQELDVNHKKILICLFFLTRLFPPHKHTYINIETFMDHATETICLDNTGVLCNIRIAQCDMGALCKIGKLCDMDVLCHVEVFYDNTLM